MPAFQNRFLGLLALQELVHRDSQIVLAGPELVEPVQERRAELGLLGREQTDHVVRRELEHEPAVVEQHSRATAWWLFPFGSGAWSSLGDAPGLLRAPDFDCDCDCDCRWLWLSRAPNGSPVRVPAFWREELVNRGGFDAAVAVEQELVDVARQGRDVLVHVPCHPHVLGAPQRAVDVPNDAPKHVRLPLETDLDFWVAVAVERLAGTGAVAIHPHRVRKLVQQQRGEVKPEPVARLGCGATERVRAVVHTEKLPEPDLDVREDQSLRVRLVPGLSGEGGLDVHVRRRAVVLLHFPWVRAGVVAEDGRVPAATQLGPHAPARFGVGRAGDVVAVQLADHGKGTVVADRVFESAVLLRPDLGTADPGEEGFRRFEQE